MAGCGTLGLGRAFALFLHLVVLLLRVLFVDMLMVLGVLQVLPPRRTPPPPLAPVKLLALCHFSFTPRRPRREKGKLFFLFQFGDAFIAAAAALPSLPRSTPRPRKNDRQSAVLDALLLFLLALSSLRIDEALPLRAPWPMKKDLQERFFSLARRAL